MAITTVDDIAAGLAAGPKRIPFYKALPNAALGSVQTSFYQGTDPLGGAQPPLVSAGSGYACSKATQGALQFHDAAASRWLAKLMAYSNFPGLLLIYDRLWAASFAAPTVAGTITVTTPGSLPARITDGGDEVEAWLESYAVGGASAGTLALTYLDTLGATKTGPTFTALTTPAQARCQILPLAAGSKGVSQIVSLANSATMTSGTYVLALKKLLAAIPIPSPFHKPPSVDWAALGLPLIDNNACIEIGFMPNQTSGATLQGSLTLIDK